MQQVGRIMGILFIIIYFYFYQRNFEKIKWFIFNSILLKSIFLFTNIINFYILEIISIFFQGFFHSFIDIYFPIWINHFINEKYKLL